MGKRRIRNLNALGHTDIVGYDVRADRCTEASDKYGIQTISSLDGFDFSGIDAMIISVSPDMHHEYLMVALKNRKPVFVEAGVFSDGLKEIDSEAKKNNVLVCPSCTLRFHPAVKLIKLLVENGQYGKVTNWVYHCGQYLPDWHPWESIKDFYVTRNDMGCREMVFFELTWLVDIFGYPSGVAGFSGETMGMGINDTFAFSLDFNHKSFGVFLVDVVSRLASRRLTLNLERAQIRWDWDERRVVIFDADKKRMIPMQYKSSVAFTGYNPSITEDMYIEEMKAFIDSVNGENVFPHCLQDDMRILKIMER
jgi:predicted dehydrogenase